MRNILQLGPEVGHKPTTGELISATYDDRPVIGLTVSDNEGQGYLLFEADTVSYAGDHELRYVTPIRGELILEPLDASSAHPLPKAKSPDQSGLLVSTRDDVVAIRLVIKEHKFTAIYNLETGEVWTGSRFGLSSGFRVLLKKEDEEEGREITQIV